MKKALGVVAAIASLVLAAVSLSSCAIGPAQIVDAVVCESLDKDYKPVNPLSSYPAGTSLFSISVQVRNIRPGNEVKAVWFYKDTGEKINETSYKPDRAGSGYVGFTLELPGGFPPGSYYAELYLDGGKVKTLEWSVR